MTELADAATQGREEGGAGGTDRRRHGCTYTSLVGPCQAVCCAPPRRPTLGGRRPFSPRHPPPRPLRDPPGPLPPLEARRSRARSRGSRWTSHEDGGLRPGYELKLNSYDLGVDIELADAVQRLRFEHPEVRARGRRRAARTASSAPGANIHMLGTLARTRFKVNFCKFTNETRLGLEDASRGQRASRYARGAQRHLRRAAATSWPWPATRSCWSTTATRAVCLPEVPLLGVLPGTGGLTRLVDKRKVRRDLADVFCTVAEGVKGKRAVEWGLVDDVRPAQRASTSAVDASAPRALGGDGRAAARGPRASTLDAARRRRTSDDGVDATATSTLRDRRARRAPRR